MAGAIAAIEGIREQPRVGFAHNHDKGFKTTMIGVSQQLVLGFDGNKDKDYIGL